MHEMCNYIDLAPKSTVIAHSVYFLLSLSNFWEKKLFNFLELDDFIISCSLILTNGSYLLQQIFDNVMNRDIPWPRVPEEMSFEACDLIDK